MKETPYIAVIGGGAAGLMCAATLSSLGVPTVLFERNPKVGRKLGITGKGRCNVTNHTDAAGVMANVPGNPRFLYSALNAFSPADTEAFFEARGVPLKTERGNRVFPVSDRAADIVNALRHAARCETVCARVTRILTEDGRVTGIETGDGVVRPFRAAVVATGGLSYTATGSDGDGYRFASDLGLNVTPPTPSLVPLVAEEGFCAEMMGLSLRNVAVRITDNEKKKDVYEDFGEMMFTHFGLTGPTILSGSAHLNAMKPGKYTVHIDLKPALDEKTLDKRLLSDFAGEKNRQFSNALGGLLPSKMIPVFVRLTGIPPEKAVHSVTKAEREKILHLLKDFPVTVRSFRPIEEAIVTRGGVSVKELNPATMEARKVRGLYFAGEVIDVDAYTGGFNLQIAFSTAVLAARSAAAAYASEDETDLSGKEGRPVKTEKPEKKEKTENQEKKMSYQIALDGPAGAGKSFLARSLAARLHFVYVDTGALYRAVGLYVSRQGIDKNDTEGILSCLGQISVTLEYDENGTQIVRLNGEDVSGPIRLPEASMYASAVSAVPGVRTFLLDTQRELARTHSVVMDGRDIGTVILPDADVKIFLTASDEVRAQRRYLELIGKGIVTTVEEVLNDMRVRDENDRNRDVAPLVPAADAILLDNSDLNGEETVEAALRIIREKLG